MKYMIMFVYDANAISVLKNMLSFGHYLNTDISEMAIVSNDYTEIQGTKRFFEGMGDILDEVLAVFEDKGVDELQTCQQPLE
jgi:hypothetical protein